MKFAVVSDIHCEQHPDWTRLVFERLGARRDLEFVAFLGDICTSPGDSWEKWFRPLRDLIPVPLWACRGNHDDPARWRDWFGNSEFVLVNGEADCRFVFFDSNDWKHEDKKSKWLAAALAGEQKQKFLFTHLPPKIAHWNYGMEPNRTAVYTNLCRQHGVTASFTGHMHGFDVLKQEGTMFFICGGGGGDRHDDFPVMHRSNYYLLVECGDRFHVTLCQQHRDHEQLRPMEEWINETRRPAF